MPTPLHARAQSAPTRSSRRRRRHGVIAGAGLVAAVLLAACGGGATSSAAPEPTDPPATSTTVEPSTTTTATTTPTPEAAVLEAVAGYWRTFFEANDPPNPAHPGFERFYTGDALLKSTANAQNRLDVGTAVRPGTDRLFVSRPALLELSGDHAVVQDCLVDDSTLVERVTGRVLNNTVDTNLMRLELVRVDGMWKVASNTVLASLEGARPSCG